MELSAVRSGVSALVFVRVVRSVEMSRGASLEGDSFRRTAENRRSRGEGGRTWACVNQSAINQSKNVHEPYEPYELEWLERVEFERWSAHVQVCEQCVPFSLCGFRGESPPRDDEPYISVRAYDDDGEVDHNRNCAWTRNLIGGVDGRDRCSA